VIAPSGKVLAALLAAAALGTAIAACGADEAAPGSITISQTSQPDRLDPALSFSINGLEPMWLVYTPLLTYRHAEGTEGAELIPGLATDMPEISGDGRTYSLQLREGLEYSDGTPVKASDFEHTIERVLYLQSAGASFYTGIVGAEQYLKAHDSSADIAGIRTDDQTRKITIQLTRPDAAFQNILAMVFAGLVPGDTPFTNMTQDPPPGVGPYEITDSQPNRQFVLERTPTFDELDIPDIPTGSIEKITTRIVGSEREQAEDVLDGALDYMQDPPPADLKPTILEQASDRYEERPTGTTYYFFLNTRTPPFDDPLVRQAVNYGLDREAIGRLYAGSLQPGCAFLAPGVPGYDEALDTTDCPYGDPTEPPDTERARQLIERAGASGAKVTVWGSNETETSSVVEAYADMLNEIGLDAQPRLVDSSVYYTTIENQKTEAQTGFETWYMDFPHPLDFFLQLDGDSIQPTNNPNVANIDDPQINQEIARLRPVSDLKSVEDDWAALDAYLVSPPHSYVAVFGHRKVGTFFSERMDPATAIFHPVYQNDYSSWTLKEGE
jgi:peptide/nickel transport system substrate-binding protein